MKTPLAWAMALLPCGTALAAPDLGALSWRMDVLAYRQATQTRADGVFQRVAAQPDPLWDTELRPDLAWRAEPWDAALRPRLALVNQSAATHVDSWLNEGWMRWRPVAGVSLQAGREALLWGPSMFWNPSNPFFMDNNKNNPKREIAGKDFVRARWQATPDLALSAIGQVGRGPRAAGAQRMEGFKLDWTGEAASAAAIVAAEPGRAPSWQGWAQWTATDAWLLYGEWAWRRGAAHAVPRASDGTTGWDVMTSHADRGLQMVAGLSYTFDNSWTLHAEYWHNGNGLNDAEAGAVARAATALATQPRGAADRQLGLLLDQPIPLRRNYAGLQLSGGQDATFGWTVRLVRNLDDGGTEGVVMLNLDAGERAQLWLNLMHRVGTATSEYGRYVQGSAMVGITWFAH
ncbi:MAG: hypothetical protein QM639_17435 [Rhodocyclaceae bacterium]